MSGNYRVRDLDPGERFIWLLDRISCANFLVMAELEGQPFTDETLRRGLDMLQASHPLLCAQIHEDAGGAVAFYREEGSRIPLQVEDCAEADWPQAIGGEFTARFDDPGLPLARCRLLRSPGGSLLSLTFHHAIGDARSGVSLLKDLLRFALRGIETAPRDAAPPPMHALFPEQFRWRDYPGRAEALGQQMREDFLRHGAPADLPFLSHRESRRDPRLVTIGLDAAHGRALQERCRAMGTSVHGAVCAAHLIATRNLFGDAEARALYMMCPVDLRPHLTTEIGGQLSYATTFLRSIVRVEGQPDFWPLAHEIGGDLKRRMQRGDGHVTYAALPLDKIGGSGPAFAAFAASVDELPAGSNISNVGRVPSLEGCPEVTAISFALCSLPKHLASLNVSSYEDRLTVNMTYDAAKLDVGLADRLASDLRTLLERASADEAALA